MGSIMVGSFRELQDIPGFPSIIVFATLTKLWIG